MFDNKNRSVAQICLAHRSGHGLYLFDSVELGRRNQCNFLHLKHLQAEAEAFLDSVFEHLVNCYGIKYCQGILGGEGQVRREAKMHSSPKIAEYLQNLNLTSVSDMVQQKEAGIFLPPKKKTQKDPLGGLWGEVGIGVGALTS